MTAWPMISWQWGYYWMQMVDSDYHDDGYFPVVKQRFPGDFLIMPSSEYHRHDDYEYHHK